MRRFEEITGVDEVLPRQLRYELLIDPDFIVCPNVNRVI